MSGNAFLLSQKIADFIVKVEWEEQTVQSKCPGMDLQFKKKIAEISDHFISVAEEISHFKSIMSRLGTQQWHKNIENLRAENCAKIKSLEKTYQQTCRTIEEECERLNYLSLNSFKQASQLMMQAKQFDLEKLAVHKTLALKKLCEKNITHIKRSLGNFHFKNLSAAVVISFMCAIILNLYINDKWPWQVHAQVIKQREAGKALMSAWKYLTEADKKLILQST